jgi:hypothetical protein
MIGVTHCPRAVISAVEIDSFEVMDSQPTRYVRPRAITGSSGLSGSMRQGVF